MIRTAIVGATGRMGTRLLEMTGGDRDFEVVAALVHPSDPRLGQPAGHGHAALKLAAQTDAAFDVLIDFSLPTGTMHWLQVAVERKAAVISGTTGLSDDHLAAVRMAGRAVPVLWSSNFSPGINVLLRLVGQVTRALGNAYDIEILESHHNHKVDAPSGTALALARTIIEDGERDPQTERVFGRHGDVGPRARREIGIHAMRLGDQVGRHEVHFGGNGETVVLQHVAQSRDTFARGALRAARWIVGQPPGCYSMHDVLSSEKAR